MPIEIFPLARRRAVFLFIGAFFLCISNAPHAYSQTEAVPAPKLNIVVVTGEGAMNSIRRPTPQDLAVRVEDEQGRPVAGASVTFHLPDTGPSATFGSDRTVEMVTTDEQGLARITGLRPNNVQGEFRIKLTASYQGKTASALIIETNVMALGSSSEQEGASHTRLYIVLGAAAAAGLGIAVGMAGGHKGGGAASSSGSTAFTGAT